MPSESDSLVKHIEDVLSSDDSDIVEAGFGSSEKEVATAVLTLVAIPSLTIPALFQVLRKNLYVALALVVLYVFCVFFIIQYKFHLILWVSERLKQCMNTSFA